MISVVSPIYNESENIDELCKRVMNILDGIGEEFEFILVDNGSKDSSLDTIKKLRKKNQRIKFVSLSRNFGHQGAILTGLAHASGNCVISMDGDLQHPPELIPKMVELWKKGYSVVYTTKKMMRGHGDKVPFTKKLFYRFISFISEVELSYGESDYRLLDRRVVDAIMRIPEKNKFLRGMVKWVGFSQVGIEYEVSPRKAGKSKFSIWNYISFAFDGIFSFSTVPLRVFLWVGISISVFCGFYGIYYFIMGLITLLVPGSNLLPPGSATITVSILFLGGIQLIGIGVLGEYIGRIYSQTKERPDFIVKERELS